MSSPFKRVLYFFFLPLFLYFSMYTWNWKTGHLDQIATYFGLDVTGWLLTPGRWIQENAEEFWSRYIYLVGVRQENEDLLTRLHDLELQVMQLREKAVSADRLAVLLRFRPEPHWDMLGCRVIGQKLGPNAVLDTLVVDVGTTEGVQANDPVISPRGVVGRIIRPGAFFSSVLLLTDPSSHIPVLTQEGRVPAIVQGKGPGALLDVKFIARKDMVSRGEILLSSGQGGVFPKGIPVARVVEVSADGTSLFQQVTAEPVLALRTYEEVLVLSKREPEARTPLSGDIQSVQSNATDAAVEPRHSSNATPSAVQ
ncbi:rod shape-determining protein MreC [Desulfovibrionales bacterium]